MLIRYIKNTNIHNIGDIVKIDDENGFMEINFGIAIRCNKDGSSYQEPEIRIEKGKK